METQAKKKKLVLMKTIVELQNPIHHILILFSVMLFLFSPSHAYFSRSHRFIYAGCSQDKYQPNSPSESNLNSFLSSIASSSSQVSYNSFAIGNNTPEGTVSAGTTTSSIYGLYQCRGDLQLNDCSKCVSSAVNQIGLVCPYAYGASLQLEGCYVRYERDDFLGKQDVSVKYRKCSKAVGSDDEFFRRRDDVVADLEAANGFRVSTSGLVEGYAQCLGDVSEEDCSACLAEAVRKLKIFCGSAAAAHVFLGQCYARYWASGYYNEPDSSNEDQVGKSVAIIVGVLAGLAILIVLLSICRKTMG